MMTNSIGSNIKKWRKQKGLTQEELADQLGVTGQAVSRWESGVGMPDISFVVPLAQILGVTTDTLFGMEENMGDASELRRIKEKVEAMWSNSPEERLELSEYLKRECEKNPTNYEIMCMYIENIAGLSRFVDFDGFLADQPERWEAISTDGIRKGILAIRYSTKRELVERAHYAIAWVYIHANDFEKAREHINVLPSVASNRLQEGISAQLAFWEGGFEGEKKVARQNLRNFARAMGKEIVYFLEDHVWNTSKEETVAFGKWGLGVMEAIAKQEDMALYVEHAKNKSYVYMMRSCLRAGDAEGAAEVYAEMRKSMEAYREYCEKMLQNGEIMEIFGPEEIAGMKKCVAESLEEELESIRDEEKKFCDGDVHAEFAKRV